jgi:predicted N-acetyltransferase YhbS|tara:strand:- start:6334 stop:6768 length:435 start_codon:yes stop_codon:yes gene_type:complete
MTELRKNIAKDLGWLERFYAEAGYGGTVQPEDRVFFAVSGEVIAGVVRLAIENGSLVLRGMQVAEAYRGKRIGMALLRYLADDLGNKPCFCLPYSHLEAFYGIAGFQVANDSEIPLFLAERKHAYLHRGMDVVSMVRQSSGAVL